MTFKEAFKIAMKNNEFKDATKIIDLANAMNQQTPCILFSIGDESFYYGFDGVDIHKGKHSAARAKQLIEAGHTMVIRKGN